MEAAPQQTAAKERGRVRWFSNEKAYGFIDENVFVHHTAINMKGYRTLERDAQVEFEVVDGPRGPHAANVVAI